MSVVCPGVIDTPILDKPNPDDLPQVGDFESGREMLERAIGKAYPPELLARRRPRRRDPEPARSSWPRTTPGVPGCVYRAAPSLVIRLMTRAFTGSASKGFGAGIRSRAGTAVTAPAGPLRSSASGATEPGSY